MPAGRAREVAHVMASGVWTHDHPLQRDELEALVLPPLLFADPVRHVGIRGGQVPLGEQTRYSLSMQGIADRAGNDDNTLTAKGYLIFDLVAGMKPTKRLSIERHAFFKGRSDHLADMPVVASENLRFVRIDGVVLPENHIRAYR